MIIRTRYSTGDKVYAVTASGENFIVKGPLTIGQVMVVITDSNGIEGEETFHNYMPRKETREQYMAVETGIGTGTMFSVHSLFRDRDEAEKFSNFCKEEFNIRAKKD